MLHRLPFVPDYMIKNLKELDDAAADHKEQEEAYVVVDGSGRIRLDDEVIELGKWDAVRGLPEVVRTFEDGPEGMELIAIGSDRPEGGDGVLVKDVWTD